MDHWKRLTLRGRGACATLDGAANVAASLLDQFPELVEGHLDGGCAGCGGFSALRPFEVEAKS